MKMLNLQYMIESIIEIDNAMPNVAINEVHNYSEIESFVSCLAINKMID